MYNPMLLSDLVQSHQRDLLHEAETERLAREARGDRPERHMRPTSPLASLFASIRAKRATGGRAMSERGLAGTR